MKYAKKITIAALLAVLACFFAPNPSLAVHGANADDGMLDIVARVMEDFELLLDLHDLLENLSADERNSVGSRLMVSLQGTQLVQQQIRALSKGRLFLWDAKHRHNFNHALSSGIGGKGFSGFIHGQRNPPQSLLQIGFAGNGGDHGCGPISVHNTLYSFYFYGIIDEAPCIAQIIHRLDINGGFIMGGEIGTNPETMRQLLQNMGHDTSVSYLPENLDESVRQSAAGTAILLYIGQTAPGRPAYWHYITVRYANGLFELYNVGGRDRTKRFTNSMDAWARNRAVLALITVCRG